MGAQAKENYDAYLNSLHRLIYLLGAVHTMNCLIKEGKKVAKQYALDTMKHLVQAREEFLQIKENAGLKGGCSFTENNRFDGFEVRDSFFIGSADTVCAITNPWLEKFNPKKCYLYEVGLYLQFLAFPELTFNPEMLSEEAVAEETKITENCDKKFFKKFLKFLKKGVIGGKK